MKNYEPNYETLKITFAKPISEIDKMFADVEYWGAASLEEWVESYESTRFTTIDAYTAIITSEYNMKNVAEWLGKNTEVTERIAF